MSYIPIPSLDISGCEVILTGNDDAAHWECTASPRKGMCFTRNGDGLSKKEHVTQ